MAAAGPDSGEEGDQQCTLRVHDVRGLVCRRDWSTWRVLRLIMRFRFGQRLNLIGSLEVPYYARKPRMPRALISGEYVELCEMVREDLMQDTIVDREGRKKRFYFPFWLKQLRQGRYPLIYWRMDGPFASGVRVYLMHRLVQWTSMNISFFSIC